MDTDLIKQLIQIIITGVIGPLLVWAVAVLIKLGNAKIAKIQNEQVRDMFADAMINLNESATTAVAEVQQTFVDALKTAGTFDEAAAKEAARMALIKTETIMSSAAIKTIEDAAINLDKLIKSKIEETIQYSK